MRFWILVLLSACRVEWGADQKQIVSESAASGETMVYTSAYPPVVAALEALAKEQLHGVTVRWFQAGSEKLAARLDAELLAANPGADLLMASDPIYYEKLKRAGAFIPYASLRALRLDRRYVDPDGAFVACRLSAMGLVVSDKVIDPPKSFADLWSGRFKGAVTLPDPLGSGTMFSTALVLASRYPAFASALRKNGATSSGGGTAAVDRLLRGEASVGMALVENARMAKSDRVRFVVPSDGAVVIPGDLAIVKGTKRLVLAQKVYDFLLSEPAQRVFVANHLHSPFSELPPPEGAPALVELDVKPVDWPQLAKNAERLRDEWIKAFAK